MTITKGNVLTFIGITLLAVFIFYISGIIRVTNETKEIVSLYFHQEDSYTAMYLDGNKLKSKRLYGSENTPLSIIVDVEENEPMYYKINYTTKGGTLLTEEDGYEYIYEIHIRKPSNIQGGEFQYGKNSYGQTSLIVSTND